MPQPLTAPPRIFSDARRSAVSRRATERQQRSDAARFIAEDMREEVKERLSFMQVHPTEALIVSNGTGALAGMLRQGGAQVTTLSVEQWSGGEPLPAQPADLLLVDTSLATINDLPGALLHLRGAMKPGGLLIATLIGAGSLPRLRAAMLAAESERAYPRLHPQIDDRTGSALLQRAGFTRQVVDSHTLTVRYRQLSTLVSDLRDQALGSVLATVPPPLTRAAWRAAEVAFASMADADGKVSERFELITLTAWKS